MWIVKGVNKELLEPGGPEEPEGDEPEGDEPWRPRGKPREDGDEGGGGRVEGRRLPSKTEAK